MRSRFIRNPSFVATTAALQKLSVAVFVAVWAIPAAFGQIVSTAPATAADTSPPEAATPGTNFAGFTLTGNAGLFSDYRFRGFTQTGYKPAFQGGFDLSHASGFYIGNWNSNVEQGLYRGASLEMDFYGGYKYTFLEDFTVDVGGYYYFYPTKRSATTYCAGAGTGELACATRSYVGYGRQAKEGELYVGLSWKTLSVKYWYALTNYFGLGDSYIAFPAVSTKGSSYFEVNGSYDLSDGWALVGHYGLQSIHNHAEFPLVPDQGAESNTFHPLPKNVSDYKIGATKEVSGFILGLSVVGTSRKGYFGTANGYEPGGDSRVLASVSRTF
jgi:hypothetical protein